MIGRPSKNWNSFHSLAGPIPLPIRTRVLQKSMTTCAITLSMKAIVGSTTTGMVALESTVVRSETGSDFQKRMLRSRRSPYSASRQ